MDGVLGSADRLSLAGKFSRLRERLKDPAWRRYGALLFLCKVIALAVLLLGIYAFNAFMESGHAYGQQAAGTQATTQQATTQAAAVDPYAAAKGGDLINPLNTVWTLIAAFL